MTTRNYLIATMIVFDLVALLQLARVFLGWEVTIIGVEVPMAVSYFAFFLAGTLAVWAFMLLQKDAS